MSTLHFIVAWIATVFIWQMRGRNKNKLGVKCYRKRFKRDLFDKTQVKTVKHGGFRPINLATDKTVLKMFIGAKASSILLG